MNNQNMMLLRNVSTVSWYLLPQLTLKDSKNSNKSRKVRRKHDYIMAQKCIKNCNSDELCGSKTHLMKCLRVDLVRDLLTAEV